MEENRQPGTASSAASGTPVGLAIVTGAVPVGLAIATGTRR
jgi:hypothetical protein